MSEKGRDSTPLQNSNSLYPHINNRPWDIQPGQTKLSLWPHPKKSWSRACSCVNKQNASHKFYIFPNQIKASRRNMLVIPFRHVSSN